MKYRVGRLTMLEIVLIVALSCVSVRAFSASFAYDHLINLVGISSTALFFILLSVPSIFGVFSVFRSWKQGIVVFALVLFMLCSPSILAFSQKRWFAFSGGEPSWNTSLTLAEMLVDGIILVLGCLTLYYMNWFWEMRDDFLERGSEQNEADQTCDRSYHFFFSVALTIVIATLLITVMAYSLRYAIRELINDVPTVVLIVGLGSCFTIIGLFYFYLRRSGIRSAEVVESLSLVIDQPKQEKLMGESQLLKTEVKKLAEKPPVSEHELGKVEIADKYYAEFNRIGWVQWLEWLDDSLGEKPKVPISIMRNENIVLSKSFGSWSAPSIVRWLPPGFEKKERLNLSSLVATEYRLILQYGPKRKNTFIEIVYKDITAIDEIPGGNISIHAKGRRIDFIGMDKDIQGLLADFMVAICERLE